MTKQLTLEKVQEAQALFEKLENELDQEGRHSINSKKKAVKEG